MNIGQPVRVIEVESERPETPTRDDPKEATPERKEKAQPKQPAKVGV